MKQWLASSALALSLASGSVLAGQPNQQDMEMIFASQGTPIQSEHLSQYEMVEIEGELFWVPVAIGVGMAVGAASTYGVNWWKNRPQTPASLGVGAAGGAIGGVYGQGVMRAGGLAYSGVRSYSSLPSNFVRMHGTAVGYGGAGVYNNPHQNLTRSGNSWWTRPVVSPSSPWGSRNGFNNWRSN